MNHNQSTKKNYQIDIKEKIPKISLDNITKKMNNNNYVVKRNKENIEKFLTNLISNNINHFNDSFEYSDEISKITNISMSTCLFNNENLYSNLF